MLISEFIFKPKKEEKNTSTRNIALGTAGAVGGLAGVRNRYGKTMKEAASTGYQLNRKKNYEVGRLKRAVQARSTPNLSDKVTPGLGKNTKKINNVIKKRIGTVRNLNTSLAANTNKYTRALNIRKASKLGALGVGALGTAAATRSYLNNRNKRK